VSGPEAGRPPVAVVAGAARGIGHTIAGDLRARGFRVVIGDLDPAATEAAARALGGRLGPMLRVARLLPTGVQDWLDDRLGTDRIGLGGEPAARAAYLRGVQDESRPTT